MLECQRSEFHLPPDQHYLNCAYMSPLARCVEAAGVEAIRRKRFPAEILPADFFQGPDRVRQLAAELVGLAHPERVALVPSVSYGMGIVARNTRVERHQNVVTVHHQFPANIYPWRRLTAAVGAALRVVAPESGPHRAGQWNAQILEAIDGDTALVAIAPVHWTDGTRFDLETIGQRARDVGAAFVLDGTQSVGAMPFDWEKVQPDALICAGYKWLMGPYAIGVAMFGPRYDDGIPLEETWIGRKGSEDFGGLVEYRDEYRSGAARFDVGETSNFILVPMLARALEQIAEWTVEGIADYCRALTADLFDALGELHIGVEDEPWRAPHLFGLRFPADRSIRDVRDELAAKGVWVSVRGDVIRVSPHVYNDQSDIAALIDALRA